MKKIFLIILSLLLLWHISAQPNSNYLRLMFYNCENFFDTKDDPDKWDEQFTPEGVKHWTEKKYWTKVNHIGQVILAVGGLKPPEIVGLCEVENRAVLEDLVHKSPIKPFNYQIVHYESPDHRGIDVALIYRPDRFRVDTSYPIPVIFPRDMGKPTRDILYVRGTTPWNDTLHIFVNHWPSRFGGHMETDPKRLFVARLLRSKVDSLLNRNPRAYIVIMGDLNDFPTDISLTQGLHPRTDFDTIITKDIYNISYYLQETRGLFSHRFHGEGGILDQIIVSGALLDKKGNLYTDKDLAGIFSSPFLLEKDPEYPGYRTNRTYIGMKYHGGYSDHLPAYLDIFHKTKK